MEFLHNIMNIMLPEVVIILFIFVQIIMSMFLDIKFYKIAKGFTLLAIILATGLCTQVQIDPLYYAFKDSIISDNYTIFFKCIILISSEIILM